MPTNDKDNQDKHGAGVKFPPPLIFLLILLAAYCCHIWLPLTMPFPSLLSAVGMGFLLLSCVLLSKLFFDFRRAKTHIEPWKPTSHIITTGIFAYSRNPIYLAFCFISIGLALIVNSVWILCSVFLSAYLVYVIAIKKEESYLEAKFGESYLVYKRRVRRWI